MGELPRFLHLGRGVGRACSVSVMTFWLEVVGMVFCLEGMVLLLEVVIEGDPASSWKSSLRHWKGSPQQSTRSSKAPTTHLHPLT